MNLTTKQFRDLLLSHSKVLSRGHDQRLSVSFPNTFLRELMSSTSAIGNTDSQIFSAFCRDIYSKYGYGLDFAAALYIDAFLYFSKLKAAGVDLKGVKSDVNQAIEKLKHALCHNANSDTWDINAQLNGLSQDVLSALHEYRSLWTPGALTTVNRSTADSIRVKVTDCISFKADPLSWHVANKYAGGTEFRNPQIALLPQKLAAEHLVTLLSRVCDTGRELVIIGKTPDPLALEIFHANLDNIPMLWVIPVVGLETRDFFYKDLALSLGGSVSDDISLDCASKNIIADLGSCESLAYDQGQINITVSSHLKKAASDHASKFGKEIEDNPTRALGLMRNRIIINVGGKTTLEAETKYFEMLEAIRLITSIQATGWISKGDLVMTLNASLSPSGLRACIIECIDKVYDDFPIEIGKLIANSLEAALLLARSERCTI